MSRFFQNLTQTTWVSYSYSKPADYIGFCNNRKQNVTPRSLRVLVYSSDWLQSPPLRITYRLNSNLQSRKAIKMKVPVSPSSPFPTEQGWSRYMLACSEAALLCRKIKVAHYKKKEVYSLTKPHVSVVQRWQTHSFSHFCFVGFPSSLFSFLFFMTSDQSGYSRIVSPHVSLQQCLALIFHFHPCFAGLSCRPSARARGTWSTVHFATERCPCLSSSPWWTAPCSSALRGTTRSSMTFRVTCKVRLALAFHQNLLTVIRSS